MKCLPSSKPLCRKYRGVKYLSQKIASNLTPSISPVVSYPLQQTVADAVVAHGIGVHTGTEVQLVIRPAPPGTGYQFRRVDLPGQPLIPAHINCVSRTMLATALAHDGAEITTVEHLLSALVGCGVDNAFLEMDSFEVPIFDGSAAPIVEAIQKTGTVFQPAARRRFKVVREVEVRTEDAWIRIEPSPALIIDYTLEYDHPHIGTQKLLYVHSQARYRSEIAHARTFSLLEDVERMYEMNLAKGGSLENAVVIGPDGVVNPEGKRYEDECVRHKVLDLIGDFSLIGGELVAKITAWRSGHSVNRMAVLDILASDAVFTEEVTNPILEQTVFQELGMEHLA